jgi:hypothetical protein
MVIDEGVVHDVVDRAEVLRHRLAVAALDQGRICEQGRTALEIEEAGGPVEFELDLLPIEEVEDGDIVFPETEVLEGLLEWLGRKEQVRNDDDEGALAGSSRPLRGSP